MCLLCHFLSSVKWLVSEETCISAQTNGYRSEHQLCYDFTLVGWWPLLGCWYTELYILQFPAPRLEPRMVNRRSLKSSTFESKNISDSMNCTQSRISCFDGDLINTFCFGIQVCYETVRNKLNLGYRSHHWQWKYTVSAGGDYIPPLICYGWPFVSKLWQVYVRFRPSYICI